MGPPEVSILSSYGLQGHLVGLCHNEAGARQCKGVPVVPERRSRTEPEGKEAVEE